MSIRPDQRELHQLRPLTYVWDIAPNAKGSILLRCGNTQVICAATIEEKVPGWMKAQGVTGGWTSAEYSMLPYSTLDRKQRDITKGRLDGRSSEIQRLIGRSLRAVINLEELGPRTLSIDCDVLAADGGTRTTAITGAYLALKLAVARLIKDGKLKQSPLKCAVAATSVGIWENSVVTDLCYIEDRDAAVDMNVVMTDKGEFVELQASGEEATFTQEQQQQLVSAAAEGIKKLFELQEKAWSEVSV
ncbi:MAG: ribonuclease PH [Blastochloris sp.]|jgi:ribonuclease PH|nr:ribonuclease PH [Blastochloris sp.]